MPDRHAKLLGPSGAHIWMHCTPSARLGEQFENRDTVFTAEGTRAHHVCEMLIRELSGEIELDREALRNECDDEEMWDCAMQYRDFVEEEFNAAKAEDSGASLMVEVEVDISDYVPESFGTSDAVILGGTMLRVIDYKHGRGVRVEAAGNPQLRLYALGAYLQFGPLYDFETVKIEVFQPRLGNVSTEVITVAELLDWAENVVKPAAQLAYRGEGEFIVGDHCRFCKAGGVCRARAEDAFRIIDLADTQPATLSDAEIPEILGKLDNAERWIKSFKAYALDRAAYGGVKFDGYKVVESRTTRKIEDQIKAFNILEQNGYDRDDVTTMQLCSISSLEKTMGKERFKELLGNLVVKPRGGPTLVPDSDRRPEFNIIENAFKDLEEENV